MYPSCPTGGELFLSNRTIIGVKQIMFPLAQIHAMGTFCNVKGYLSNCKSCIGYDLQSKRIW